MRSFPVFLIGLLLSYSSCGQKNKKVIEAKPSVVSSNFPKAIGWVSDFEKILTTSEINYLDSIIQLHEKKTTNEIAVVTYKPDTAIIKTMQDFDKFSLELFNEWGVGKKDKNNGVGMIISTSYRKIRIETGPGLVTKLTNAESKNIIDTIILPEFKKADYFNGIAKGLEAIFNEIQ